MDRLAKILMKIAEDIEGEMLFGGKKALMCYIRYGGLLMVDFVFNLDFNTLEAFESGLRSCVIGRENIYGRG